MLMYGRNQTNIVKQSSFSYETAKETLMYRSVLWTLWERERERERVGGFGNMYNIMYEMSLQSRFDARYWMLGAGALG